MLSIVSSSFSALRVHRKNGAAGCYFLTAGHNETSNSMHAKSFFSTLMAGCFEAHLQCNRRHKSCRKLSVTSVRIGLALFWFLRPVKVHGAFLEAFVAVESRRRKSSGRALFPTASTLKAHVTLACERGVIADVGEGGDRMRKTESRLLSAKGASEFIRTALKTNCWRSCDSSP